MSGHTAMGAERGAMPTFSPSLVLENPGDNGPSYFHNELRVSGWAADTERVTVELAPLDGDGNVRGPGVKLSERLQTSVEARKSRFDLRVRTAECSRGIHSLNVSVTGRDGAELKA